jgi:hypothetical protein
MYIIIIVIVILSLILMCSEMSLNNIIFVPYVYNEKFKIQNNYKIKYDDLIEKNIDNGKNDEFINMLYYKHPISDKIIIYSHGNGGSIYDRQDEMKYLSQFCSIIMYDYSGYGKSNGLPNEKNVYSNILQVWKYITNKLKYTSQNIILYGESLGGSISLHLASELKNYCPKNIIIRSSFSSINDLAHVYFNWIPNIIIDFLTINKFNSKEKIKNINNDVQIYIFHSKNDNLIPYSQAIQLLNNSNNSNNSDNSDNSDKTTKLIEIKGDHNTPDFGDKLYKVLQSITK